MSIHVLKPHALTLRGTFEVKATGYLEGDRASVMVNGRTMSGTVVHARPFLVEVKTDKDVLELFTESKK